MEANPGLGALLAIALVAALAPIVVGLLPRLHLPQVVVFLIGGGPIALSIRPRGEPATAEPPTAAPSHDTSTLEEEP